MPHVRVSQRALLDLTRFHEFLADKSKQAAARALESIERGLRALGTFKDLGHAINPQWPELREWVIPFWARRLRCLVSV